MRTIRVCVGALLLVVPLAFIAGSVIWSHGWLGVAIFGAAVALTASVVKGIDILVDEGLM